MVTRIADDGFTPFHREILAQIRYRDGNLHIPHPQWASAFLGAGEEKAVFCVCEHHHRVFAIEVIDERSYLNGRFVGGKYFSEMYVEGLRGLKADPGSLLGLMFTGKIKVREFVYGYEWGRFQWEPGRQGVIDVILTSWLQSLLSSQFNFYRERYKDVHDRNVMFEIRPLRDKGVPAISKDWAGNVRLVKVGLQPIDVR